MTSFNHHRVLYAENDEDTRFMVTTMLGLSGIEVATAGTTAEAWRIGHTETFDLYLLDSRFSDGSGLDLCRRLREHAPHTPIIFYSGDAFDADVQGGLAAGANSYLTKPYFGDLHTTVKQSIERAETSAREIKTGFLKAKSAPLDLRNDTPFVSEKYFKLLNRRHIRS